MRLRRPVVHERKVLGIEEHIWIILDHIQGEGLHTAESFLHFHPDVALTKLSNGRIQSARKGQVLTVFGMGFDDVVIACGQVEPPQGWFSSQFGSKSARSTICWTRSARAPFAFGHILVAGQAGRASVEVDSHSVGRFVITVDERQWTLRVCEESGKIDCAGPDRKIRE
jgi:hypothetical protein